MGSGNFDWPLRPEILLFDRAIGQSRKQWNGVDLVDSAPAAERLLKWNAKDKK